MPKLTCICGEIVNLSEIPSPYGFKIFADLVIDAIVTDIITSFQKSPSTAEFEKQLYKLFEPETYRVVQAYECPHCGRLAVFGKSEQDVPDLWYRIEKRKEPTVSLSTLTKPL